MKLTDHVNVYNSLTNFEYEVIEMTGNGNYVNLLGKIVKSCHVNLFLADFRFLERL